MINPSDKSNKPLLMNQISLLIISFNYKSNKFLDETIVTRTNFTSLYKMTQVVNAEEKKNKRKREKRNLDDCTE